MSRRKCDKEFEKNMKTECGCYGRAKIIYMLVRAFGQSQYIKNQRHACYPSPY